MVAASTLSFHFNATMDIISLIPSSSLSYVSGNRLAKVARIGWAYVSVFHLFIYNSWNSEGKETEWANKEDAALFELCLHQESPQSPHQGCLAQIHTPLAHNRDRHGGVLISQSQLINPRITLRSNLGWGLSSVCEEEQTGCNRVSVKRSLAAHTNSYQ